MTQPQDTPETLKHIALLYEKYSDDIVYYNYPGLLFYLSPSFTWLSTQSQAYYGSAVPFFTFFFRGGSCSFEHPSYLGPGERIMERLKKDCLGWVEESKQKTQKAEHYAEEWLGDNPVVQGKTLQEYLRLLQESNKVLLETHIPFQIAVHIDRHLKRQLSEIFHGSLLNWDDILKLSTPIGRSAIVLHDKEAARFREWCRSQGISLTLNAYKKNMGNSAFVKRLEACYNLGYFLHSGFGGVTLWKLEDEYQYVCKNILEPKETKPIAPPNLTSEQQKWIAISSYLMELRERKKILQHRFYFYQAQLLEEIAKILGISRAELEHLHIDQFTYKFLTRPDVQKTISYQKKGYLVFWEPALGLNIWVGNDAIRAHSLISENKKVSETTELKGQGACSGKVTGPVKIVRNPRLDITKFHKGDILVTGMTSPDFVLLMEKAAGIVTEIGGLTCHAAIVAREMGKPCIIGTNIATRVLKDGDLVEVNANEGIVRILKRH